MRVLVWYSYSLACTKAPNFSRSSQLAGFDGSALQIDSYRQLVVSTAPYPASSASRLKLPTVEELMFQENREYYTSTPVSTFPYSRKYISFVS